MGLCSLRPPGQDMDEEATCSICLELLQELVTIGCGHNFCRACITKYCEDAVRGSGDAVPCPSCRADFQIGSFRLNMQLKNLVEKIKEQSLKPGKEQRSTQCLEHEEKLKLFCEEDGEAICVICRESQAHRGHTVLPIQEAANNFQVGDTTDLREPIAQTHTYLAGEINKVKRQREGIKAECKKLRCFASEEEQWLLQRLKEEERETLRSLKANVAQLSRQSSSLRTLISEIEEKSWQTPAELLKDVKRTLDRGRWGRPAFLFPHFLFPLVLSEDRKCVRHGDTRQDLPDTPERFDPCVCVLDSEGITDGRRYWEVEVGDKTRWTLGMCRESVRRKGKVTCSPGNGYWAVWLNDAGYKALISPWTPLPMRVRPRRVGVFLDYEGGEVSFYNVTDRSHLFTFTDTFSGTLRPFFYPGLSVGGTNAAPLTLCPVPAQP
ncbi:E3 ubiquitin-protein ligase TRIM39 [Alligator mississippiensis]|uniref:E3 ubiquitin-protein ligase TRIM39 n=1 Tax=Alligator mississippiensis TaxID=8496 RepID=UPI0028773395|nr:E3 ubiquitin-protein ligase TRIM39 [Alligator mississippiensis]